MGMSPRLLRPRATGFSPRSIAGLAQWLDANDAGTITLASGAVSAWADKSGNGRNASQATPANRPTTTTVNGKTAILFDGVSDGLDFTGVARTEETWIIAAAQAASQTGQRQLLSDGTDGNGLSATTASVMLFEASFGGFTEGTDRLRVQWSSNASTPLGPAILSAVRSSAAGGFVYINGTQRGGAVSPFTSSFSTAKSDTMSKIGYYSPSLYQFNGWIGEILCYNRALTASERISVERYLGSKWGIAIGPQVSNADAQDWINRVYTNDGTVSATTAAAVNTFCNAIDAASLRDRFYRLNLFCGTGLNACLVPLYRGPSLGGTQYGNTTDTNNGPFVSGDYVETGGSGGLQGNGTTKSLDTGLNASVLPSAASIHLAAWKSAGTVSGGRAFVSVRDTANLNIFRIFKNTGVGNNLDTILGALTLATSGVDSANDNAGMVIGSRTSATSLALFRNGVSVGTATTSTAGTLPSRPFFVFADNQSTGAQERWPHRMSAYSIGTGLTSTQAADYYNALSAFMAALSRT